MVEYDFKKDVFFIREELQMTQKDFAAKLGVSNVTVSRWESGLSVPREREMEEVYGFAMENGLRFNLIKTRFLEDDRKENVLLFHGARKRIEGEIDLLHANPKSDMGIGFYLGETLVQAGSWISEEKEGSVYCFYFDPDGLKGARFGVDRDWMMAVCFYRGYLEGHRENEALRRIVKRIEDSDYIVAPIADNVMYATLREFAENLITDEQCFHALSANHLGMQYVLKSEKAIKALTPKERLYLCEGERETYRKKKGEEQENGVSKLKAARIQYKGKGSYIDELFS